MCVQRGLKFTESSQLENKRDLYNLSRTCKGFEDVCLRRLYAQVELGLPVGMVRSRYKDTLDYVRPHVMRVMRDLSVRNALLDNSNSSSTRKHVVEEGKMTAFVHAIVEQVPMNQLRAFS